MPWQVAVDRLYRLLQERRPEESISHKTMPSFEAHRAFVESHPYAHWYMIHAAHHIVGAVYLTHAREVGIGILIDHRHSGYARAALAELRRLHPGPLLANINPSNTKSLELFKSLGARLIQHTYEF
jgi:hypothetical protein